MGGRRARTSFRYQAFVPDEIAALSPVVPFEVADLSADAEAAIRALNDRASVRGLEAIGPLLLRSEAVASSRIEGYDVSSLNLARALIDPRAARGSARIVAANVSAMEEAIAIGDRTAPATVDDLLAIHAVLMAGDERAQPGRVREEQNWIGGRLGNRPMRPSCRRRRASSCHARDSSRSSPRGHSRARPRRQVAHAQFETIHPFIDGSRVGRASCTSSCGAAAWPLASSAGQHRPRGPAHRVVEGSRRSERASPTGSARSRRAAHAALMLDRAGGQVAVPASDVARRAGREAVPLRSSSSRAAPCQCLGSDRRAATMRAGSRRSRRSEKGVAGSRRHPPAEERVRPPVRRHELSTCRAIEGVSSARRGAGPAQ
jgi:hypothetical protein